MKLLVAIVPVTPGNVDQEVVAILEAVGQQINGYVGAAPECELRRHGIRTAVGGSDHIDRLISGGVQVCSRADVSDWARVMFTVVSNLSSAQFTSVISSTGPPAAALLPSPPPFV